VTAKRERPADGGMVWQNELNAFQCHGCEEFHEVHSRRRREDPEHMAMLREMLIVDHTECWKFNDSQMARNARKYRSEKTRRSNLASRAGHALDRQATSWRGRNA
jgi:hypothetical protein